MSKFDAIVEVVTATTSKTHVFSSGNHGNGWTIWEMKMLAHLMEKGWMHILIHFLPLNLHRSRRS